MQAVFDLDDGSALFVTVASYQTPSRADIDQRGIKPDSKCSVPAVRVGDDNDVPISIRAVGVWQVSHFYDFFFVPFTLPPAFYVLSLRSQEWMYHLLPHVRMCDGYKPHGTHIAARDTLIYLNTFPHERESSGSSSLLSTARKW